MTVAELIAALQELPAEWPVYVRGYEEGVDDVTQLRPSHFERDHYEGQPDYYGRHRDANEGAEIRKVARNLDYNGVELRHP